MDIKNNKFIIKLAEMIKRSKPPLNLEFTKKIDQPADPQGRDSKNLLLQHYEENLRNFLNRTY